MNKHYSFQSSYRETDLSIAKFGINSQYFQYNDFIGPIGQYDLGFLSPAPPERDEYLTLVTPFDLYSWAFIMASLVGVTVSLILIEKVQAIWTKQPSDDTVYRCKSEVWIIIFRFLHLFSSYRYLIFSWRHYWWGPRGRFWQQLHLISVWLNC